MRTTVVPAQITTVEDRVAGNLTFVQVLLLIASLLLGSAIYLVLPPHRHPGTGKLVLIALEFLFLAGLALRIKGKIVADWLILYLRFASRPRIYVFTKNDPVFRDLVVEEPKKVEKAKVAVKKVAEVIPVLSLPEQDQIEKLLTNESLTLRFAFAKKGGIDVSLTPTD
jgi:hypothetical protein